MEEKELSDGLTKGVGAASSADEPRTPVIFQREMGREREGEWTKRGHASGRRVCIPWPFGWRRFQASKGLNAESPTQASGTAALCPREGSAGDTSPLRTRQPELSARQGPD